MNKPLFALLYGSIVFGLADISAQIEAPAHQRELTIVDRGPDHRVLQSVHLRTNQGGHIIATTNSFVHLQTGLHYEHNGQWLESKAFIEVDPEGGARAEQGRHKAWFAANIDSPFTLKVNTPDNKTLKTRILGLAFYDFKKRQSVLLAEVRNTEGILVGDNQVIYPNAFDGGFRADVCFTYTLDGVEQDVILKERPPLPEDFEFDPRSTWLEVWTEFIDSPEPAIEQRVRKGWRESKVDRKIDFGGMKIPQGSAFGFDDIQQRHTGLPVRKHWVTAENRTFLIEEISFRLAVPELRALPVAAQAALPRKARQGHRLVSNDRMWPERRMAEKKSNQTMRVAQAPIEQKGFIVDYSLLLSTNDFTFRGDTTYYVSGTVNLSGLTTIEAGTVVKYTNGATVNILDAVNCLAEAYRPAVFTSYQDNSVGESFAGGEPSGTYASVALALAQGGDLQFLHVRYAGTGIKSEEDYSLTHSQFVHCDKALQTESANFYTGNLLMYDVTNAFYGRAFHGTNEHLTLHQIVKVVDDSTFDPPNCDTNDPPTNLLLRNSLVFGFGSWGDFEPDLEYTEYSATDPGSIFKAVGAASHYLAENSPYRNAQTATISTGLTNQLQQMTTYAPVVLSEAYFATNTVLHPQARRDTNLDCLGYHYSALDFCIGEKVLSEHTLTLTNGVAVGFYNTDGGVNFPSCALAIECGARLISEGSPLNLNHLTWINTVQEQATTNWGSYADFDSIAMWNYSCDAVEILCRFTDFSKLAGGNSHIGMGDIGLGGIVSLRDSQIRGGAMTLMSRAASYEPLIASFTNCVFDQAQLSCFGWEESLTVEAWNNLFYRNTITLDDGDTNIGATTLTFRDNFFYETLIGQSNTVAVTHDHNGYLTNQHRLSPNGTGDVILLSLSFEEGLLSHFYQPITSPLINAGSRNSPDAGLYHFTVVTNQVKETNTAVDIGSHWVALSNGVPVDTDGDGLGDWFEDTNGDGIKQTTEWDWEDADTDGDGLNDFGEWLYGRNPLISGTATDSTHSIQLKVFTPLK